jgi:hypothetical protein
MLQISVVNMVAFEQEGGIERDFSQKQARNPLQYEK